MPNVPMLELKDKDGNLFYPVTKVEAVLDDNGNNIDDYIDDKVAGKTGHQILDDEGTAVAQKSKLQFENATVENVGDKTVVTPLSGVTTEPFQTAQGTTAIPMVNSFNGRQGAVSPTNGDYTADMVGAIPVQSGTQGQVLGFVSDNVIGAVDPVSGGVTSFNSRTGDITPAQGDYSIEQISATGTRGQVIGLTADNTIGVMNAPTPTYTGTAGQVLGFTATDTVGAINPPQPTYTGSQGQLLGFTDVNTVGAKNPTALFTGTAGQVLGFTGTNTVGAVNMDYLGNWTTIRQVVLGPPVGETSLNGSYHDFGSFVIPAAGQYTPGGDGLYLLIINGPNYGYTSAAIGILTIQMCTSINTGAPDYRLVYHDQCAYPAGMGRTSVDGNSTAMSAALIMFLKQGTGIKVDSTTSPMTANGIDYNHEMLSYSLYKLE